MDGMGKGERRRRATCSSKAGLSDQSLYFHISISMLETKLNQNHFLWYTIYRTEHNAEHIVGIQKHF